MACDKVLHIRAGHCCHHRGFSGTDKIEGFAVHAFKDDSIRGIHLYGNDFFGVALNKTVYVGQFKNDNLTEIGRIPLNEKVYADAHGDSSLLEFKLIDASSALICVPRACSMCSMRIDLTPDCYDIHLKFEKLSSVSATVVKNNVIIRTVYNKDDASIHYLFPTHQFKEYVFGKWSIDPFNRNEIETVAAFSTAIHSYFVGSAKQPNTSLFPFNHKNYDNVNWNLQQ
uniref:GDE_N domain-containing protein n=1 Tax=Panagrellus redivivus TaxID=6233 RepID=A0A7E4VHA6_PANRE